MKKIITVVVAIIAIVSVLLINLTNNLDKFKIDSEIYFYQFNEKVSFNGAKIKNSNEKSILESDGKTLELTSEPIYYKNEKVLFLPKEMGIVNYETGQIKKVNHFSKIVEKNNDIYIDYFGEEKLLNKYFLYDGEDTYLFLEKINIKVGDGEFTLDPLSYIKLVNNNTQIQVYSKDLDEFSTLDVADIKIQAISNYGYEIDLKLDSFKNFNGEQLLIKNVKGLSKF